MKKKSLLIITLIITIMLLSISFAEDENPEPKGMMPQICHEHHIMNCNSCIY